MTSTSLPASSAIVIIGGGMAGLSCAASLARRGIRDVILLEGKTLAHARASSFGETRMFREMYSDPVLCRLAQEANRRWREEEAHAGEVLRDTHGRLFYGKAGMKRRSKDRSRAPAKSWTSRAFPMKP
jgi:glycine/D-amino acid oxidase-like deaminating enzyme